MPLTLKQVAAKVETYLPLHFQESYDRSGLQVGSPSQKITKVMFALDACREVIRAAKKEKAQLIVTHHPLSLSDFRNINLDTYEGSLIGEAIKNDIAIYTAHTNHDVTEYGLSHQFAKDLGLQDLGPLRAVKNYPVLKLVVYVPQDHTQRVLDALFAAGAGKIGAYSECSFRTEGTGTFKGDETTNPHIGKPGVREEANEDRIEVIFEKGKFKQVLHALVQAHPYEEVAYDVHHFEYAPIRVGMGVKGSLKKELSLKELVPQIKKVFGIKEFRLSGKPVGKVKIIGICNGSGASLLNDAKKEGVDLFITGDVKYHAAIEAMRTDMAIADVGHFHSEKQSAACLRGLFEEWFGEDLKYTEYKGLKDPFEVV